MRSCVMCHEKDPTRRHRMLPRVCCWAACTGADQEGDMGTGWGGTGSEGALTRLKCGPLLNFLMASTEDNIPTLHLDFPKCSVVLGKIKMFQFHKHLMRCPYSQGACKHNWWYPEEINKDAAISQKPMIANAFMQLSGDQGEKWMRTGMSLFVVSLCLCLCASS